MRICIVFFILFLPFLVVSQEINTVDKNGQKQGAWLKYYNNGNLKYQGQFKDNKAYGLFFYFYNTGELKAEKEFFHNGEAAATHFFYKDCTLKSAGLYVR